MAQKLTLLSLTLLFALVVFSAIGIPLIEPDAAIYADIAREMFYNQSYEITYKGEDWLDKPHLPFWLSALAYFIFDVSLFGYKLPAILASLLGVFYTYKFAGTYYDKRTAILAVGVLISSLHFLLSLQDVRAEPFLMGFMAMAFYHLVRYFEQARLTDFWLSALAAGLMMMTKGVFVLIPLFSAIFAAILIHKSYRRLLELRWYLWIIAVLFFTSPVIIAYYLQFDAQPLKSVDLREWGIQQNVSGIKFFFWDSQFGRFFNTGPIQGEGSYDFYFHTLLWAFWPWGLLIYFATAQLIYKLIKRQPVTEVYSLFAILPMFFIFSLSSFQLPHYLNILFPFFAVITAAYLINFFKLKLWIQLAHTAYFWFAAALLLTIPIIFSGFDFSIIGYALLGGIIALFIAQFFYFKQLALTMFIGVSLATHLIINLEFYPRLLDYQVSTTAARFIQQNPALSQLPIASYGVNARSITFNLDRLEQPLQQCSQTPMLVLVNEKRLAEFRTMCPNHQALAEFADFPVSQLTPEFVIPSSREQAVETIVLMQTQPIP